MIDIVVVDDHELVCTGFTRLLEGVSGFRVLAQGNSGEEAIRLVKELAPDIVLLDIKMPGIGGLGATRKLRRSYPAVKIIIVTMCEEDPFPSKLLQAGASGYVSKSSAMQELINAIQLVHAGERYVSPIVAQNLALKSFPGSDKSTPFDELSERELQIALMIVNCQKVQDIAEQLFISPKTVNSYRYRVFEKLGIESDVELTLAALRYGIIDAHSVG